MNRVFKHKLMGGALALMGLAYGPGALALDSFNIYCEEAYESDPDSTNEFQREPFYVCDLTSIPTKVHGEKAIPTRVDSITFSVADKPADVTILACPGWWFINGRWVYDAVPPCPGRTEIEAAHERIRAKSKALGTQKDGVVKPAN